MPLNYDPLTCFVLIRTESARNGLLIPFQKQAMLSEDLQAVLFSARVI